MYSALSNCDMSNKQTPSNNDAFVANGNNKDGAVSSRTLCRYFTSNICFKGDACEFSHDRTARPDMVCRYYLTGNCAYGSRCRYDHVRPKPENLEKTSDKLQQIHANKLSPSTSYGNSQQIPNILTGANKMSVPENNPWNTPPLNPLDNYYRDLGFELELIGNQDEQTNITGRNILSNNVAHDKIIPPMPTSELPLCPYFELGFCYQDELCHFLHGLPCEMCGLNVLHPYNETQRVAHHRECLAEHEQQMEAAFADARSADKQCGICMEMIVEKKLRFGILQNCSHCFCLDCIRKWRKQHNQQAEQFQPKTVRSCPECRVHSDFVIPSKVWMDEKKDKDKLVAHFHENTKKIQCKYVIAGDVDNCPFGNKCFYKHQAPDGAMLEGKSPEELREQRRHRFDFGDFMFDIVGLGVWTFSDTDDDN